MTIQFTDEQIHAAATGDLVEYARIRALLERRQAEARLTVRPEPPAESPGKLAIKLGHEQRPHLEILDELHVRARVGEVVRACVSIPARHGKTERLLKVGSVWRLDEDPDCRIMQISGAKSLVEQSSRWVRDELERPGGDYRVRPRSDVRAVSDWQIDGHIGGIFVGSMTSRIIGRGANLLLVDDLIGSAKEADSTLYRQNAWRFLQGAMGRLEPDASVIVVNSRWHADDPIGRLLKEQPGRWEYISIPALAEDHGPDPDPQNLGKCVCGDVWDGHGDPLGRAPGDPLWPERYDVEALASRRLEMGAFLFSAQMQQRPLKREGGLWREEWITDKRIPEMTVEEQIEKLRLRTVSVDPSASDEDTGDEAGIVVLGKHRETGDAVVTADLSGHYTPEGWARTALVAAVELGADVVYEKNLTPVFMKRSFKAAWEALSREADNAEDEGLEPGTVERVLGSGRVELPRLMPSTTPVSAKVGKELRASPVAQRYEQRRVCHAGVFPVMEEQMLTWRPIEKDSPDRLDALVHGVTHLGDAHAPGKVETSETRAQMPTGSRGAMPTRGGLAGSRIAMGRRGQLGPGS